MFRHRSSSISSAPSFFPKTWKVRGHQGLPAVAPRLFFGFQIVYALIDDDLRHAASGAGKQSGLIFVLNNRCSWNGACVQMPLE
jgi:hypothetical protein